MKTDWQVYRDIRLQALRESPDSFVATFDEEQQYDEQSSREQMLRARRFIAERDGKTVGMVGLRLHDQDPDVEEVFAMGIDAGTRAPRRVGPGANCG